MRVQLGNGPHRSRAIFQDLGICPRTGKKRFRFTDADRVAILHRRRRGTNHHPYRCSDCGDFHVGSSDRLSRPNRGRRTPHHRWGREGVDRHG